MCLFATISERGCGVAESTKDLLAAKKENLANGVYGPSVSITQGDTLYSYYLCRKNKTCIEKWLCFTAAFK